MSALNEDCLRHLFKFLKLKDLVRLAETYPWLRHIAKDFCKKIEKIKVLYYHDDDDDDNYTMQEFSNILSVMGEHITLIKVYPGSDILKLIADKCSNIGSVEVYNYAGTATQGMQMFRNLKELKVGYNINLSTDGWKNYFANNPGIETFEYAADIFYDFNYERKYIPLLHMLPKLKSLKIHAEFTNEIKISHLSCLTSLTKLSFSSDDKDDMCNQLLMELADKLNLVELEFYMPSYNGNSFATLKYFRNLEIFWMQSGYQTRIPEAAIFPSTLKKIKLKDFYLSCSVFLSIVKQLKFLQEFAMENGSFIFCENDKGKSFY